MTEPAVVVLSERIGPLTEWERGIAARVLATVECRPLGDVRQIRANLADARVAIVGAVEPFGADVFAALPELGLVARRGVGVDNVDLAAASRHGVLVTNVPDATVEEVSDHALTLLLALQRRVHQAHGAMWRGRLADARKVVDATAPFAEATLGVVGCGRIGRRLIEKASGVYGQVVASDPFVDSVPGAKGVSLSELLTSADAISLHAPLTDDTRGLLGADALRQVRPGVVVVNTARAGVADEPALADAVRAELVAGVGLDVYEHEQLWRELIDDGYGNILLTGHTAARGARAQDRLRRTCADQVTDYLSGRRPANIVNHDREAS